MLTLQEIINIKREELENIEIDTTDLDFINIFTPEIPSICQNDFIDIIIIFYMIRMNKSLEETLEDLNVITPLLSELEELDLEDILVLLSFFKEINIKYGDKLNNRTTKDYLNLKNKDPLIKDVKNLIKELKAQYTEEIIDGYLKWMSYDDYANIITLAAKLKALDKNFTSIPAEFDDIITTGREMRKKKNQSINNIIDTYTKLNTKKFKDDLDEIKTYKNQKSKEINSKKKEINKQLKCLADLEKDLLNNTLSLESIKKYCLDAEIIKSALVELIKNRNIEFKKNYATLNNYNQNPINKLEIIFNSFGYNLNLLTEDEQILLSKGYNEEIIKENLAFISTSSLSFIREIDEGFVKLITLDSSLLMQLDSLLMRGKITKEFILKYYNKLNSLTIGLLISNINKLDSQKVDFNQLLAYNDTILFDLNTKLLDMIVAYNINLRNENLKYFEFLEKPKLLDIIDKYIEIGLLKQIQTLPNLIISNSNVIIRRIILMQEINQDYINERGTLNQTARNEKDFYLADVELTEYINENFNIYMDQDMYEILNTSANLELIDVIPEEITFIENYKKNNQSYIINGNYFSRIKVLRCLKTLIDNGYTDYETILFNSLIYNYPTYLSIDLIEELKDITNYGLTK